LQRIAVIADVHGNAPALRAVLAEIDELGVDLIVDCGDTVSGPLPGPTLRLLSAQGARLRSVLGNSDREVVAAFDERGRPPEGGPAGGMAAAARFAAARITRAQRDELAARPPTLALEHRVLGAIRFCHGTPRDTDEIVTPGTPEPRILEILADVAEAVVVGGHTHMQFDRRVGRHRFVNAGSVGMAYEGRPGAYWTLLAESVEQRRTLYDLRSAAAQIAASGYPEADDFVAENVLAPPGPEVAVPIFERQAAGGRPGT
jgi:putative phosphoesterase